MKSIYSIFRQEAEILKVIKKNPYK